MERLSVCRERLKLAAHAAWILFLSDFGDQYDEFRRAVRQLAVLDCLLGLARVAASPGFTKPVFGLFRLFFFFLLFFKYKLSMD